MVKKRENGYVRIINEPAKTRIAEDKCPSCGKPRNEWKRRKDWACCSPECTQKFEDFCIIRTWPQLREQCFIRDSYTCKKCGIQPRKDFEWNPTNYSKEEAINYMKQWSGSYPLMIEEKDGRITHAVPEKLIADHILAIALNGEQWDINNLQTLCEQCNKEKTRKDARKIAALRRIEKKLVNGQKKLEQEKDMSEEEKNIEKEQNEL
jgi:5-methylcytosine-specific restriction endonuclease McrA